MQIKSASHSHKTGLLHRLCFHAVKVVIFILRTNFLKKILEKVTECTGRLQPIDFVLTLIFINLFLFCQELREFKDPAGHDAAKVIIVGAVKKNNPPRAGRVGTTPPFL